MIVDLVLRFTWFVDVFPIFQLKNPFLVDDTPTVPEDIIKMQIEKLLLSRLLLRLLEIIRRWLWIFFRLEREVSLYKQYCYFFFFITNQFFYLLIFFIVGLHKIRICKN